MKTNTTPHYSKLNSRKFIVFLICAVIFVVLSFCFKNSPEVITTYIPWFGLITISYIGGNVANKVIDKKVGEL